MKAIPTVEPNLFFKEATLRICGSLEVEKAVWDCLLYIRQHIPVERLTFHIYDDHGSVIETVAFANPRSSVALAKKTKLNAAGRRVLQGWFSKPVTRIIENMRDDPVTGPVARDMGFPICAGIVMQLEIEKKNLGAVAVTGGPKSRYGPQHAKLFELLKKPFAIALGNILRYREVVEFKEMLAHENALLHDELKQQGSREVIGVSQGIAEVQRLVRQVAPANSPVLLLGETGVGKEVFANLIHEQSSRHKGPLVKVNCGAIPETLIDSELFGHEKGAFTGAGTTKRGRFERAHKGTIFLDEIGELPRDAQVRLLRVLQEKEIERVGGSQSIKLDIRIIAATHRNLETMLANGKFREDLFYRLNVFPVQIPALRERRSDIPLLVHFFLQQKGRELGMTGIPPLAPGAMERLSAYDWPGNVRELENVVERALIVCGRSPLTFNDIRPNSCMPETDLQNPDPEASLNLDRVIAQTIGLALDKAQGRVEGDGGAAKLLGLNPGTLRHRMRKLGIAFGREVKRHKEPA